MADLKIKIDPEFRDLLPKLTTEEQQTLETSCKTEGIRDPLIIWKETHILIGGHNRYEIAQKHDLAYDVTFLEFKEREDVIKWIINDQMGKRNLTLEQRNIFIRKLYHMAKKPVGGSLSHSETPKVPEGATAQKIADQVGVSVATVNRAVAAGKPATKANKSKEPKNGAEVFSITAFDADHGRWVTWIDKLCRAYGHLNAGGTVKETPEVKGLQRLLATFGKDFKKLHKELNAAFMKKQKEKL